MKPEERRSGMSDPDLSADCRQRLVALRRDQPELQADGVTVARLDQFEADLDVFEKLPADTLDEQIKARETQRRNAAMEDLRIPLRAVRGPVEDAYGDRSPEYRSLGLADMAELNDADLLRAAVTAGAAGKLLLDDLKIVTEGLNQDRLDAIEPAAAKFKAVIGEQTRLVTTRSLNAHARARKHNLLHDECGTLCAKGVRRYEDTDPKRADD